MYGAGSHTQAVTFTVKSRAATCRVQRARAHVLEVVTEYRSGPQEDRKGTSIKIVQPEVPVRPECTDSTGGVQGDPHMWSMDGLAYDAQVHGEYWYTRPPSGTDGPQLQVRHESTNPSLPAGAVAPTSATALALRVDGH